MQTWIEVICKNGKVHCFDNLLEARAYSEISGKSIARCVQYMADDDFTNGRFRTIDVKEFFESRIKED